jgi:hypothetical protein
LLVYDKDKWRHAVAHVRAALPGAHAMAAPAALVACEPAGVDDMIMCIVSIEYCVTIALVKYIIPL